MSQSRYYINSRWGGSENDPPVERMREVIAELFETRDEEHPDASLEHITSGWALALDEDGLAYLYDPEINIVSHMKGLNSQRALDLWKRFADGGHEAVASEAWLAGAPYQSPEEISAIKERQYQLTLESDRRFFDVLGAERADIRCKRQGCIKGAISGSVFCRSHHFEQVFNRASLFQE